MGGWSTCPKKCKSGQGSITEFAEIKRVSPTQAAIVLSSMAREDAEAIATKEEIAEVMAAEGKRQIQTRDQALGKLAKAAQSEQTAETEKDHAVENTGRDKEEDGAGQGKAQKGKGKNNLGGNNLGAFFVFLFSLCVWVFSWGFNYSKMAN